MGITTSISSENGNRILTIEVSGEQAKFDSLANDAAKFYYQAGGNWQNDDRFKTEDENGELQITAYEDLTLQQKINILGFEAVRWLKEGAKAYYRNNEINTRESEIETEVETRYI